MIKFWDPRLCQKLTKFYANFGPKIYKGQIKKWRGARLDEKIIKKIIKKGHFLITFWVHRELVRVRALEILTTFQNWQLEHDFLKYVKIVKWRWGGSKTNMSNFFTKLKMSKISSNFDQKFSQNCHKFFHFLKDAQFGQETMFKKPKLTCKNCEILCEFFGDFFVIFWSSLFWCKFCQNWQKFYKIL